MINNILGKLRYFINRRRKGSTGVIDSRNILTIKPKSIKTKGRILYSYLLIDPLNIDDSYNWHSNKWECAEMIKILSDMGYIVDVMDFRSHPISFEYDYDVIIDIDINLQFYAPLFENALNIMHITTGYGRFLNDAEIKRVSELEKRRGLGYSPKRLCHYLELFDRSLEIADKCSLIGNSVTKSTFPDELQKKIVPITVSASKLNYIKSPEEYVPQEREFIWFFGFGAVAKGLDLLLEIFVQNPDLTLNIIGYLEQEPDFIKIYEKELTQYPNIKYHGSMSPLSKKFESIVRKCFCFLAPTCSEGLSPAVATMMQVGLYPIITRQSGAVLPENAGKFIEMISHSEIDAKIKEVYNKKDEELVNEIKQTQSLSLKCYSREQFSKEIKDFFINTLS